jgi:WD40 repeat protein
VSARDSTYRLRAAVNANWDVFISYSSDDKAVVRAVAERLRADGLRVWFDDWEIPAGGHIQTKIDEALASARVLVLCMSAHAYGSDWVKLESGTFRFRDPLNRDLRFIPLRLDEARVPEALAQFRYLDWREGKRDGEYQGLLAACRPPEPAQEPLSGAAATGPGVTTISLGHTASVRSVALSGDGRTAVSGSADKTVRVWDVETSQCLKVMQGHTDSVTSVALSGDGRRAVSGSDDKTVRVWDVETSRCLKVMQGHTYSVLSVALSGDGRRAVSGSDDKTVRVWDVETSRCLKVMEGHTASVWSVALSGDGRRAVSGSEDKTVRVWDVETSQLPEGHARPHR